MKTNASAVSFSAILLCEISDFGQQLSVCVDGIIEGKATEQLASQLAGLEPLGIRVHEAV